jgi:hypothetical protein
MIGSNGDHKRTPYEEKFDDFIRMLAQTPEQVVIIHHPRGDWGHLREIVESLNRIADATKSLMIMPRNER